MNDYTLVAYIGDHNIVEKREETLRQKRDKILGSLSMHANLQERAKNRTNTNTSLHAVHGGYNTISGRDKIQYSIVEALYIIFIKTTISQLCEAIIKF